MQNRVLVVEDDREVGALIVRYLKQEGCCVDIAEDGLHALGLLDDCTYRLVILDIMLPGIDGLSILRTVRKRNDTPVIIVSARSDEVDTITGLEMGADDYITKPFSINELMARIRVQLRRSCRPVSYHSDVSDTIVYEDIEIDPAARTVRKSGSPVGLTSTEFQILRLLVENSGRVYTKSQIREQVWKDSIYLEDNTIMVHISNIRKKIESNPVDPQIIRTIWGFGYAVGV